MVVAVPAFGSRVAPTFLHCEQILLARIVGSETVLLGTMACGGLTEDERIKWLEDRHVSVLVCGGIHAELRAELAERGIEVIHNVAGNTDDVLQRMARGRLIPGDGLSRRLPTATHGPPPLARSGVAPARPADCVACLDKVCLTSEPCSRAWRVTQHDFPGGGKLSRLKEAAMDIAAEPERILCRIAEVVYFALELECRRVGLAFCVDLFPEAETVRRVLGRYFEVIPLCCRIDGPGRAEEQDENESHAAGSICNAPLMARILNDAATDLNIAMGLSIGSDMIFSRLSVAPVTTLVVKDRLLANNPISAVHSRYVLEQVMGRS